MDTRTAGRGCRWTMEYLFYNDTLTSTDPPPLHLNCHLLQHLHFYLPFQTPFLLFGFLRIFLLSWAESLQQEEPIKPGRRSTGTDPAVLIEGICWALLRCALRSARPIWVMDLLLFLDQIFFFLFTAVSGTFLCCTFTCSRLRSFGPEVVFVVLCTHCSPPPGAMTASCVIMGEWQQFCCYASENVSNADVRAEFSSAGNELWRPKTEHLVDREETFCSQLQTAVWCPITVKWCVYIWALVEVWHPNSVCVNMFSQVHVCCCTHTCSCREPPPLQVRTCSAFPVFFLSHKRTCPRSILDVLRNPALLPRACGSMAQQHNNISGF